MSRCIVVRKGKEETKTVKLGRLDDGEKPVKASATPTPPEDKSVVQKALGLQLSNMTDELRKKYKIKDSVKGVVITGDRRRFGRRRQAARRRQHHRRDRAGADDGAPTCRSRSTR